MPELFECANRDDLHGMPVYPETTTRSTRVFMVDMKTLPSFAEAALSAAPTDMVRTPAYTRTATDGKSRARNKSEASKMTTILFVDVC